VSNDIKPTPKPEPATANKPIAKATQSKGKGYKFLTVRAITGSPTDPIAMLNTDVKNYNIMKGDKMDVKTPDGKLSIKCVDIKNGTVELQVGGDSETIKILAR
jgi:hypothetical protein